MSCQPGKTAVANAQQLKSLSPVNRFELFRREREKNINCAEIADGFRVSTSNNIKHRHGRCFVYETVQN